MRLIICRRGKLSRARIIVPMIDFHVVAAADMNCGWDSDVCGLSSDVTPLTKEGPSSHSQTTFKYPINRVRCPIIMLFNTRLSDSNHYYWWQWAAESRSRRLAAYFIRVTVYALTIVWHLGNFPSDIWSGVRILFCTVLRPPLPPVLIFNNRFGKRVNKYWLSRDSSKTIGPKEKTSGLSCMGVYPFRRITWLRPQLRIAMEMEEKVNSAVLSHCWEGKIQSSVLAFY